MKNRKKVLKNSTLLQFKETKEIVLANYVKGIPSEMKNKNNNNNKETKKETSLLNF